MCSLSAKKYPNHLSFGCFFWCTVYAVLQRVPKIINIQMSKQAALLSHITYTGNSLFFFALFLFSPVDQIQCKYRLRFLFWRIKSDIIPEKSVLMQHYYLIFFYINIFIVLFLNHGSHIRLNGLFSALFSFLTA